MKTTHAGGIAQNFDDPWIDLRQKEKIKECDPKPNTIFRRTDAGQENELNIQKRLRTMAVMIVDVVNAMDFTVPYICPVRSNTILFPSLIMEASQCPYVDEIN